MISRGTIFERTSTIASAERPTSHTPIVSAPVRKGVENDENTSATLASRQTSPRQSTSVATIGATATSERAHIAIAATSTEIDHGTTTAVLSVTFAKRTPSTASDAKNTLRTTYDATPACSAETWNCTAPMMQMNTSEVSTIPTNFPRRNCHRFIGFGRMT